MIDPSRVGSCPLPEDIARYPDKYAAEAPDFSGTVSRIFRPFGP